MAAISKQPAGRTAAMGWSIAGLGVIWAVVIMNLPTMRDVVAPPSPLRGSIAERSAGERSQAAAVQAPAKPRPQAVKPSVGSPAQTGPSLNAAPAPKPAADPPVRWKEQPAYMSACAAEIKRLCAKVAGQDGPVVACLQRQARDLSNRCYVTLPSTAGGPTATRITRSAK